MNTRIVQIVTEELDKIYPKMGWLVLNRYMKMLNINPDIVTQKDLFSVLDLIREKSLNKVLGLSIAEERIKSIKEVLKEKN